ncbi:hypothetical protein AMJ47_02200 [Parcubacteria bacterium DG_72]|nr:MAG: hypothetical protein AMJ47_02200 [Parcubacteria bacterium DG_72]
MNIFSNRGVSLYLAVVLMTMLLALVLGISTILFKQLQTIKGMEDSVIALYAADSGIERVLVDVIANRQDPYPQYSDSLGNEASYDVDVVCCQSGIGDCVWGGSFICPLSSSDPDCLAYFYCVTSRGFYGPPGNRTKTQRAIQVAL